MASDRVAVLDKALDLLEALSDRPGLQVAEAAEAAGITKPAAYRILSTLEQRGYVVSYERVRRYFVGYAFHMFQAATHVSDRLLSLAHPEMAILLSSSGETVNLGMLVRRGVFYVDVLQSPQSLRASSEIGSFDTLHATALGKAMMTRMSDQERAEIFLREPLVARTRRTVTDIDSLTRQINVASVAGFARDDEENEIGMCCVAAPITNADARPVAAISISGPTLRMDATAIAQISVDLVAACARISAALAASPAPAPAPAQQWKTGG